MKRVLLGALVASAVLANAGTATAQSVEQTQRRAFVLNAGPMIGILGGGFYARINPEFQLHRGNRFEGHTLNLGLSVVLWPNEAGPSFSFAARYQFDQQLVPGTQFFVSPYVGLEAGLGIFDVFDGSSAPRFVFLATPTAGLDVKLLLGRLVLGLRPVGVTVPIFFGGSRVTADVIWDIAFSIGVTY